MLESYKVEFIDFSRPTSITLKYPLPSAHEIWVGYYHLGQGHHGSTEPELVDTVYARDFKTACFKHELQSTLESIERSELTDKYIDSQTYEWFYKPQSNGNSWTGKYYPTKEEALKSFKTR